MRGLSISLKLAAWYACSLLLGLAAFGIIMWFVLAHSMLSWKDRTLQMRAGRVETVLSTATTASGQPFTQQAVDARLSELLGILPEGEWIQLTRGDGRRIFPHGSSPSGMPVLPFTPCALPVLRDRFAGREKFRQLCQPVTYAGQPAVLLVPSPLAEDHILLRTFTLGLLRIVPLILITSVVGGYVLSRRALRPVDLLIAEAQSITATDLSRRLTVPAADDQMRTLAVAWNGLLARIQTAMIQVTQFTADASHELRNPIAYIRTAAEFHLGDTAIDDDSREAFGAIADEAILAGELLENLLVLAHPDAQLSSAEIEPVDMSVATREIVLSFAALARKKNQTLNIIPSGPNLMLLINPLHLRRILTAIFDNAVKYTPSAGRIAISYELKKSFSLRIMDNGIGIENRHLPRVFDRFYRVDPARSEVGEGVGLGLPIAKWLTERYGGQIEIVSELGNGTAVTVTFPGSMVLGHEVPV